MESLESLWTKAESDRDSEDILLLSELLASKGGYLFPSELEAALTFASEISSLESPTAFQRSWLNDYIVTYPSVKLADENFENNERAKSPKPGVSGMQGRPLPPMPNEAYDQQTGQRESNEHRFVRSLPTLPSIKLNELVKKPKTFEGDKKLALSWLEDYEQAARDNGWSDRLKVRYFPTFLGADATNWYKMISAEIKPLTPFMEIRSKFVRHYLGPKEIEAAKNEWRNATQRKDEQASSFIPRMVNLMTLARLKFSEEEKVEEVKAKMRRTYREHMIGAKLSNLIDLNDLCLEIESIHLTVDTKNQLSYKRKDGKNQFKSAKPVSTEENKDTPTCTYCNKPGHTQERCFTRINKERAKQNITKPAPKKNAPATSADNTNAVKQVGEVTIIKNVTSVVSAVGKSGWILIPVHLNDQPFEAMVDTGSKLSLIDTETARSLQVEGDGREIAMIGADQKPLTSTGEVIITFKIKIGTTVKMVDWKFVVIEQLCVPALLGTELLGLLNIVPNPRTLKVRFEEGVKGVKVCKDQIIDPKSASTISVEVPYDLANTVLMTVPTSIGTNLLLANTVDQVKPDGTMNCLVANLDNAPILVPEGLNLGAYEKIESCDERENSTSSSSDRECPAGLIAPIGDKNDTITIGDQLSEEQSKELLELVSDSIKAFSIGGQLGRTNLVEHNIELEPGAKPFKERLRRRPQAHILDAKQKVKEMLEREVIEPSSSPFASAYVLVKKKSGELRFCVDYRRLNSMTKKNVYPLPNIEDCIDALGGNKFFSQLDLASGYWQIKMAKQARELTAFRTEEGHFQYKCMPFGLCNAPASFQRLVNALFTGLKGVHLQIFIDDICVATPTWPEHMMMLKQVFKLLIDANLKLKASKCVFGSDRVLCDASLAGIAGILLQRQQEEWRIVYCCSRKLSDAELKYAATEIEGLAIIYSVTKLRNYLLGRHFSILTDHCALCSLKDKWSTSSRLQRWAMILQEYDYSIHYVKGTKHCDVDCLSRSPVDPAPDPYLDDRISCALALQSKLPNEVLAILPRDVGQWKIESINDDEGQVHFAKARARTKGYKIYHGLLYYEDRLFVPMNKRDDLMRENHADSPACHGGIRATLDRMALYWWPEMPNDVRKFVESCQICQARKAERALPRGEMFSFEASEPFQLVAIDALGPLPASISGKRHVLVAIDCFSRYVYAKATKDVQGQTATKFLQKFISQFGAPEVLLSDNAPSFCNENVRALCSKFLIEQRHSTPHHHEGNAMVERAIQTLQEKLSLLTHDPAWNTNWEEALPDSLLSMNTNIHLATGYTPVELVFGISKQTRSNYVVQQRGPYDAYIQASETMRERRAGDVVARQAEQQALNKVRFDDEHRSITFEIGELVLAKVIGRRTKLQNRFVGPYRVVKRERDIYDIESWSGRRETLKRHVSDLKPYMVRQKDANDSVTINQPNSQDQNQSDQISSSTSDQSSSNQNQSLNNSCQSTITKELNQTDMRKQHLLLLFLICNPLQAIEFEEAPYVGWAASRTYVSPQATHFILHMRYSDCCHVLKQFEAADLSPNDLEPAFEQCKSDFVRDITWVLGAIPGNKASMPQLPTAQGARLTR